jgi:AraC-like DNA-binding protein
VLVDRGDTELRVGERTSRVLPGALLIIAPGEVVTPGTTHPHHGSSGVDGWVVFFDPHLLTGSSTIPPSWSRQPLLLPSGRGPSAAQHLRVPDTEMAAWLARFTALHEELAERHDGFTEATLAHLALLLVDVARLAQRTGPTERLRDEPLLAKVFAVIDARYRDQLSLRDVAAEVALTPGHLSTVVGRRTGRTVQQWITERRMAEARTLLTDSTAPVATIARRVGYPDASYFIKHFRRAHQLTPGQWRDAARAGSADVGSSSAHRQSSW